MMILTSYLPITDPTLIFFVVLLIILFAPIVMSKLRIPHIIGMVLAGVVIGQYGFNILERDNSFELFGRVGLYYIMFLAGLEMDMQGAKKQSQRFLIFGLLTCLVPLILTYIMAMAFLGYSGKASFLLGCIMASNTLIAYPIIGRYGLQRHPSVALSVGSSMISLFLALVMLAALSGSFENNSGWMFWFLFVAKFALFCAGSIILIPKLTRYFLRRYSDAVMQYIFVLGIMFLSASLTSLIGLEGIFGAFFSGLILNRYIPHVSPLMNRIEFIGNALFIPYFLIGVGMRLEVVPGQYLVNDDMLNGVVMMILFTCIISTLMTEHASQQIILQEKRHPHNEAPQTDDEKILLCVKYPEIAPHLLYLSILMRNQRLNRELVALNVVYDDQKSNTARQEGIQLLERLQQTASASDVKVQTQVRLATNIANGIKHAFREFACSEIIMGMHVHTDANPRFWGEFIQSLYNGLNRQIMLTRFVQPMSTLRRIQVVVPSRAEFEPGFHRWLERLSRLAGQLDCRIQFHGRNESLVLIAEYINNRHPNVRAEYTSMAHWNELPQLAAGIAEDHLFVVVTARKGTISYKNALERLPDELQKHYSGKNLMIIFPDQFGNTKDEHMSFTEAQHHEEKSIYDAILRWIHEKRKVNNE